MVFSTDSVCIYNPRRLIRHVRLSLGNRHVFKGSFYHVRSYVSNHRNHTAELLNWCSFDNLENVFYYENINIGKSVVKRSENMDYEINICLYK